MSVAPSAAFIKKHKIAKDLITSHLLGLTVWSNTGLTVKDRNLRTIFHQFGPRQTYGDVRSGTGPDITSWKGVRWTTSKSIQNTDILEILVERDDTEYVVVVLFNQHGDKITIAPFPKLMALAERVDLTPA